METKYNELNQELTDNDQGVSHPINQQNKSYLLNPTQVTVDPINNFYKKINNDVPLILDEYLNNLLNANNKEVNQQTDLRNQISNLEHAIENEKKTNKILGRKVANFFIFVSFFLILGLFLMPIYLKNRKIIKEFENNKSDKLAEINYLFDQHKKLSLQFTNQLSCHTIIDYVSKKLGLGYENNCNQTLWNFYNRQDGFLSISASMIFKYKNTPIINSYVKLLNFRDIITFNTMTFPYQAVETYYDGDGLRTRTVTRYETLKATHIENTPFVDFEQSLLLLTNFKNNLDIVTDQKKHLKFENSEFSKLYKINTNNDMIDADVMEFFTIKAQEDYVTWYRQFPNNALNFSKIGDHFNLMPPDDYVVDAINTSYNFNSVINDRFDDINVAANKVKNIIYSYFEQLARSMMSAMLSPTINREWYNFDNQYKIANENNFATKITNQKELNYNYILSRIDKPENLFFINEEPARRPWIKVLKRHNNADGFVEFDCLYQSYRSEILIDYVTVVGAHVGPKTIPVEFERFFDITEPKKIFFLPKEQNKNNHTFLISSNLDQSYYDLYNEITNKQDNPTFNNWTKKIKLWLLNPHQIIKQNQEDYYAEILEQIRNNYDPRISIEANDDGYFIIVNPVNNDELKNVELNGIIRKLKNLLLELKELND
ncbi:hypothetical protein [Mycoplasma sp. E35C]|uniref:hypothetical protein n=1 Tax=Mycoplasma sp. E35C TaxID=2801918 RepID=UPI001CA4654F|nr:hypothetical protein [Mycoplasma sp. E35C]QZX48871.1 hypothetical protein JJE79_02320 [Mycoplasma sp. E35C]